MRLRIILVEPIYEGNVGSVARAMKNLAASFQDAATSSSMSPRREYHGKRANVVSRHETEIKVSSLFSVGS
jgi:tRNA(Leu) C34 or U34 (ribose-2'-O)-methylase TrmL